MNPVSPQLEVVSHPLPSFQIILRLIASKKLGCISNMGAHKE